MLSFIKKNRVLIIFIIFFAMLLFQHQFLWLYHDDYGYASLSYAVDIGNIGHEYGILDIFNFLGQHYLQWGGRITCFFIECLLLRFGLPIYRIAQSIVILAIFYLIYKLVSKRTNISDYKVALLTISMYGFLEIMIVRDGIFWITGAVNYLFPLLTFLLLVYFVETNKDKGKLFFVLQILLAFFAGFSHEQTSAMTIAFLVFIIIKEKILTKKFNIKKIVTFIFALVGFLLLLFCPGSYNRLGSTSSFDGMNIFEKLDFSFTNLINGFFSEYNGAFLFIFFLMILYISIENIKNNKNNNFIIKIASFSNIVIVLISFLKRSSNYFIFMQSLFSNSIYHVLILFVFIIQLCLIVYSLIIFIGKKDLLLINLFISSLASISVMLISSYYPMRASLGFIIINYIIFLVIFCKFFENNKRLRYFNYFLVAICIFAFINYGTITKGYYNNSFVNKYNDNILQQSSLKIKQGKNIEEIVLKKLPDIAYSGDQPYIDGFEYIKKWIKNYYELPERIKIVYE